MPNLWLISDTHFGHANILTFKGQNGLPIRGGFHNVHEMDEYMIERWNATVKPCDKIYHLGDLTMHRDLSSIASIMFRLNGHKRLVRGNHDVAPTKQYLQWFDEIYASRVLDRMILTHIPIHPESLGRFKANIHGHIHERKSFGPQYVNVSVEAIDYTPVALETIRDKFK